ncbi:MAG: DUF4347 domain-containing protein [Prochloraceae cyanobacterium]|nr:DUF4347 domain-containing protein [Prochloraceae cyanobacterium]
MVSSLNLKAKNLVKFSETISQEKAFVVIDRSVPDYENLVRGVVPGNYILVLEEDRDGIEQISAALSLQTDITSIHLVSHGAPGCIYLGNSQLSLDTLDKYAQQLRTWFTSSVSPNLLIYGCKVAAGDGGAEFLDKLHHLTGANIAASAKLTGNQALGGDWELEVKLGTIKPSIAFIGEVKKAYSGVFAPTRLLEGLPPGREGSALLLLDGISDNGTLFFSGYDDTNGYELWKSDGTTEGTTLVKDIRPNSNYYDEVLNSYPIGFESVNGTVLFAANNGPNGYELWKTDGTTAGTTLVKDIIPGNESGIEPVSFAVSSINVNNTLFFSTVNNSQEVELWKSDGTTAGTISVYTFDGEGGPLYLTNVNETLFFAKYDDVDRVFELWKSDGTPSGTHVIDGIPGFSDIKTGKKNLLVEPLSFAHINGTFFFTNNDETNGRELWKSDGTAEGTTIVKDINPGQDGSNPDNITVVNDTLYFTADNGSNGRELWKSDGTEAGTILVKDIQPNNRGPYDSQYPLSSEPLNLTNVNGTLFFTASDFSHGRELWKSDGTAAGTTLVKDINPVFKAGDGGVGSDPLDLTNVNGTLYFSADDETNGRELWKSDGTAKGTTLVADISPGKGSSDPKYLLNVDGNLFFRADDNINNGSDWWVISDDPLSALPVVSFKEATYSQSEGLKAYITLTRFGDTTQASTVKVNINDGGTAIAGKDYNNSFPQEIQFAANETETTFNIALYSDATTETVETISLGLESVDNATLAENQTTVLNIEDVSVDTAPLTLSRSTVQIAYVAYYGRPGDRGGLDFWSDILRDNRVSYSPREGDTLTGEEKTIYDRIVGEFGNSEEQQRLFGGLANDRDKLNQIYKFVFNRDGETEGLDFWSGQLQNGNITLASASLEIALGAQNQDIIILNNKIESANLFIESLNTEEEQKAYAGGSAESFARDWLSNYGLITSSQSEVDSSIENLVNGGNTATA